MGDLLINEGESNCVVCASETYTGSISSFLLIYLFIFLFFLCSTYFEYFVYLPFVKLRKNKKKHKFHLIE